MQNRMFAGAQMTSPINLVLERLDGVISTGKSFKALCPAHGDKAPSLSVKEGGDGRVLLHCFAGCGIEDIVAAMGLRISHLFSSDRGRQHVNQTPGVSARELKAATEHELKILFIVKADRNAGRAISPSDLQRTKIALDRIAMARRVI